MSYLKQLIAGSSENQGHRFLTGRRKGTGRFKKAIFRMAVISVFIFFGGVQASFAQDDETVIQFSGLVLTSDSLMGIPYATILIKGEGRGTLTNYKGFFSLVALGGDTIIFSSAGFRPVETVIPDTLSQSKYSVIQLLSPDTIFLPETVIYPWPSKEEFRSAFLELNLPEDDLDRAMRNLEREKLKELGELMTMDAGENTDYYMRREAAKFYYAGQIPPQNIFNPFAWAQFIEAWKNGDFKRK